MPIDKHAHRHTCYPPRHADKHGRTDMLCPSTLIIGTRAHTQPLCAPAGMFWLAGRVCASECVSSHIMMINMWKCFRCQENGALPVCPPPSELICPFLSLLKYLKNSSFACLFSFHIGEWPIIMICASRWMAESGILALGNHGHWGWGGCFYTGARDWAHNS